MQPVTIKAPKRSIRVRSAAADWQQKRQRHRDRHMDHIKTQMLRSSTTYGDSSAAADTPRTNSQAISNMLNVTGWLENTTSIAHQDYQ
eukprot:6054655-Pyramimonas_sp.AAC.1